MSQYTTFVDKFSLQKPSFQKPPAGGSFSEKALVRQACTVAGQPQGAR
jgi:hypothetical protein